MGFIPNARVNTEIHESGKCSPTSSITYLLPPLSMTKPSASMVAYRLRFITLPISKQSREFKKYPMKDLLQISCGVTQMVTSLALVSLREVQGTSLVKTSVRAFCMKMIRQEFIGLISCVRQAINSCLVESWQLYGAHLITAEDMKILPVS